MQNSNFKSMIKIKNYFQVKRYTLHATRSMGFSLIELLIYIGILVSVLSIVTNLLITSSFFSAEQAARTEIQQAGRFALEKITRDLQTASSITTPADSAPTNNLAMITPSGNISYQISEARLQRTDVNSTENASGNQVKIDSITFTRIETTTPSIKIDLVVDYIGEVEGNRDISQDFSTTYYLK